MLNYAHQKAIQVLSVPHTVVLVTSGPAGVQADEFPCEAKGLVLYVLVPRISDHLFNLEHNSTTTLLAAGWELKGEGQVMPANAPIPELSLLQESGAQWCVLVRIDPWQIQIRRVAGWGNIETIDLNSPR